MSSGRFFCVACAETRFLEREQKKPRRRLFCKDMLPYVRMQSGFSTVEIINRVAKLAEGREINYRDKGQPDAAYIGN